MGNHIYYPDLSLVCHPVDLEALYLEDAQEKRTAYSTLPGLEAYLTVDSRQPSLIL